MDLLRFHPFWHHTCKHIEISCDGHVVFFCIHALLYEKSFGVRKGEEEWQGREAAASSQPPHMGARDKSDQSIVHHHVSHSSTLHCLYALNCISISVVLLVSSLV